MSTVEVPATWIAGGQLGALCARHGVPQDGQQSRTFFTTTPLWVTPLILLGVLPLLIVASIVRKKVKGSIPTCVRCRLERRRYVLAVVGTLVLGMFTFVVGAGQSNGGALLFTSFVLMVLALVAGLLGDQLRVRGVLSRDQSTVRLAGVCEQFARDAQVTRSRPLNRGLSVSAK